MGQSDDDPDIPIKNLRLLSVTILHEAKENTAEICRNNG